MTRTPGLHATAPGGASGDYFGNSVAISGDTVVVGAPFVDLVRPYAQDVGAAYVYVYDAPGDTYLLQARLDRPGTAEPCENFGGSVAISGERIVVGSGWTVSACNPGLSQIHEFMRSGTAWTVGASFTPSDCVSGQACFGANVALAGSLLTVGLPNEMLGGVQSGTVKIVSSDDGWLERLPAVVGAGSDCGFGLRHVGRGKFDAFGRRPDERHLRSRVRADLRAVSRGSGTGSRRRLRGRRRSTNGFRHRLWSPYGSPTPATAAFSSRILSTIESRSTGPISTSFRALSGWHVRRGR